MLFVPSLPPSEKALTLALPPACSRRWDRTKRRKSFRFECRTNHNPSVLCCATSAGSNDGGGERIGKVMLVGVGPGACNQLTHAGEMALQGADIILYDRLSDIAGLKQKASDGTVFENVGKYGLPKAVDDSASKKNTKQGAINSRIVELAKSGYNVVRIKGGDVSIFGRLADELRAIREENIQVDVVPGVTTASAVAAHLQFSLTDAKGVCFISGHDGASWVPVNLVSHVTLVIYMGLKHIHDLLDRFMCDDACNERIRNTAAVAVQSVLMPEEQVVWGTIATLSDNIRCAELGSPTLVVIGDVVRLAKDWPLERQNEGGEESSQNA